MISELLPFTYESLKEFIKSKSIDSVFKSFQLEALEFLFQSKFPNSEMESWRKISLRNLDLKKILPTEFSRSDKNQKIDKKFEYYLKHILREYKDNFFALLQFSLSNQIHYFPNLSENLILEDKFDSQHNSFFKMSVISVSKNQTVQIVEKIKPDSSSMSLILPFTYLDIEEDSTVEYTEIDSYGKTDIHIRNIMTEQQKNSHLTLNHFYLSGYKGKTLIENRLLGEHSQMSIVGVGSLNGNEFHDLEFKVNHLASHSQSEIKYRTILNDKSHHIFTGNLNIPKTSKRVIASQVNHNLSLSTKSRAESMPKLEVFAEDVKCSHGATVSEVSGEQLFYLLSRGITETESRRLIIEGFLKEIIDSIKNEDLKINLLNDLTSKLHL